MRTKGGATKEQIKRRPEFENVRRNNKEFGGCSKMSREIRSTFSPLAHVADYNHAPIFCSVAKNIQKSDIVNPWGERNIRLSQFKQYLIDFDFNRINRFGSVLRIPLQWNIDWEVHRAVVDIPAFACSFGLYLPGNYLLFRLSATLGIATDFQINDNKNGYEHTHYNVGSIYRAASTPWYSTQASVPEQQIDIDVHAGATHFCDDDTLILSIAIEFGTLDAFGNPTPLKHAGAGKILGVR